MISAGLPHACARMLSITIALCLLIALWPAQAWSGSFAIGNADGSFETGLNGMTSQGDVRLIANVGILLPTQGAQAALLTSEPDGGSTPTDVDMSVLRIDNVTIAADFAQLRIDYNFFTNEPAASLTNDRFAVDLILVNSSGQETLLEVDTFSTLFPAPLTPFARQTGFRTLVADVSAHAGSGESVALELRLTDVGDGRFDSAVLVDNMQLTRADEPESIANVEYLVIEPGEAFIFDGFASPDPNADITEYEWDFGDGTGAFGPIAEHTYSAPGLYQATLTVTDRDGNRQTDTFLVAVGMVSAAPSITSSAPVLVPQGGVYRYDVEAEDADLATGDVLTYQLVQAPLGMTIDSQTGLIEWRPASDSPRQAPVTVEVQDRVAQRDTQSFTIVVDAEVLVVATNDNGEVFYASSMGDGTFGPLQFLTRTGFNTNGVAQADFDGDGDFDVVTGHAVEPTLFLYYVENLGSRFASPAFIGAVGDSTTPAGRSLRDMAAADVNADGLMDFAVNGDSSATWLFQRNEAFVFGQETFLNTDFEVDAGGWENPDCGTDFALDATTSNGGSQSMRVFATSNNACMSIEIVPGDWDLYQGPVLTFAYRIPPGTPVGLVVDVTLGGSLFLGGTATADGGSRPSVPAVQLIDDNNWHTATIDLTQAIRQQWPQASRINHLEWRTEFNAQAGAEFWFDDVSVTRRTLEAGFAVSTLPVAGGNGRGLDAADVNGDGHIDLVRGASSSGRIHVYQGDGTGQFTPVQVADVGSNPNGVALADFDSDGLIDLIANNGSSSIPVFLKGNGDGTFQAPQQVPSLHISDFAAYSAFDFNLDGFADIALTARNTNNVRYFPGNGDATFGTPVIVGAITTTGFGIAAPTGRVPGQPFGSLVADQTDISEGSTVAFDASDSFDDGTIVDYTWDFGDGNTATGPTVSHPFTGEGIFIVTLTITDDAGNQERQGIPITVRGTPPVANPGGPYVLNEIDAFNSRWPLALDGTGSADAETGIVRYEWDFDASDGITVDSAEARPRHIYTVPGTSTVTLTVFDAVGQSDTATTTVTVNAGTPPAAAVTGPAVVDEAAASLAAWALRADLRATADDAGVMQYHVDWGDGTSTTIDALRETFEDAEITSHPTWTPRNGVWEVIDGELHQTDVSSGWKWLQDLNTQYRDFVLELDFEGVSSNGQMGIAFRNPNTSGNQATFRLWSDDDENTWRMLDWDSNTEIAAGGTGWDPGIRYHLRLVVVGRTMQLFVTPEGGGETLQLEASSMQHPVGGIALLANGQHLIYDNVTVTPIEDSLQPMHVYEAAGDYTITLTATDAALQTGTASFDTQIRANDPPVADAGGPYVITEADAFGGRWTFGADASASADDHGVQRYTVDFGDGGQYTTGFSNSSLGSYFAAGTNLYAYLTPVSRRPRIHALEDNTEIEAVDLVTQAVLSSTTLNRLESWSPPNPASTDFITIKATKPVIALEGDEGSFSNHTTFVPSLGASPVGHEFIFLNPRFDDFFVYAIDDTVIRFFNSSGTLLAEQTLRANTYWQATQLSQRTYRVVASGRIAIQTAVVTGYTTVPANSGKSVGRQFMFATIGGTSSAYSVFAYESADIEVFDLDTGASIHTQTLATGEVAFQTGLGDRRLRLVSSGDVEVWAGDTTGGTAIEDLGDDISVTAGRDGMEFYVHTLEDGFVIFSPNEDTSIDIGDGALVTTLPRDGFLRVAPSDLPGGIGVYHLTANKPVVVQTLGRAGGFGGIGSFLGGVAMRHRYSAVGTYPLTVTVTDRAGQTHTANTTVEVQASDPPVADIVAPAQVDENDATAGQWAVPFDGSGSTDDNGIFSYEWDFGDGNTGTGVTPTHIYTAPGTYVVTLTVTDHANQQTTTTFTVEVGTNNPPVADSGGPYLFDEQSARIGVWSVAVDASGSSDDVGIFDYEWLFDQLIVTDFTGTSLDTATWLATAGVTQDDAVSITGTGQFGTRYLFSANDTGRLANLVYQARITVVSGAGLFQTHIARWGFKNSDPSDFSTSAMPHAIGFNNGTLVVYDHGDLIFGTSAINYDIGDTLDVRIILKTSGAIYEAKRPDTAVWTRLFESTNTSSETPLKVGFMVQDGTYEIDDFRFEERYFTPQVARTYTDVPKSFDITLRVRDNALQASTVTTTMTLIKNDPPVALPGGPYVFEDGNYVRFVDNVSTDDVDILRYDWDFGDGTFGTEATPTHFYSVPGTYQVTLTVTDHALQTHTATTVAGISHVSAVDVSGVIGDWQNLELSGTVAADLINPDSAPLPPFTVTFFEDIDGDGLFHAAMDNVLATASHGGLNPSETVRISAPITGNVNFRDSAILAFVDTGAANAADDRRNYGSSNAGCTFEPPAAAFDPVLEWSWSSGGDGFGNLVLSTPAVIDITGDAIPDVIFASYSNPSVGFLRAVNGHDGSEIFTVTDTNYNVRIASPIAAGDIDLDGHPEIITMANVGGGFIAFEHDGTFKWRSVFIGQPDFSGASIADLDRDGIPEVTIGSTVLNNDGTVRWRGTGGEGGSSRCKLSFAANLDMDGDPELLGGNTAYRSDGTIFWTHSNIEDGYNAVANFDADVFPEVVLSGNDVLYLFNHDGTIVWGPVNMPGTGIGSPPTVADVDGDGELEIALGQTDAFSVFEADGTLKWTTVVSENSSVNAAVAFDFEADGAVELVYVDQDHLRIYRGSDGMVIWELDSSSTTAHDMPLVVDVDADGNAEIIRFSNSGITGLHVHGDANDNWVSGRQIWNQHAYDITNVNEDGSIPREAVPSWTVRNHFRQNIRSTGPASAAPDLTAAFVRVTPDPSGNTLTARVGNAGNLLAPAGVPVSFYDGDPRTGGIFLGTVNTTQQLEPSDFEDVTVTTSAEVRDSLWVAVDDPGDMVGMVNECRDDNNLHDSGLQIVINQPPVAEAGGPYSGVEGTDLTLDGTGSSDPDGDILSFAWDLDNNGVFDDAAVANPQVRFLDEGTFVVALQVSDGPETATDTAVITITNAGPVVDAGADQSVAEGDNVSLSGATFSDSGSLDTHSATVDWGDGTTEPATVNEVDGSGTITASHLYADNGTFTVTVTVTDDDGGVGSDTLLVTVTNAAPVVEAGADQNVPEGTEVTFAGSFSDPGTNTHSINWDFGDGGTSSGSLTPAHTFDQNGTYTVTLTVTDGDGGVGTDTLTVTVTNVSPTVDTIADQTVDDGSEFILNATFNDPGNDTQTVVIDWGDGTSDTLTVGPEAGGNITAPHTYIDDGVFTVTVTVTDEDGGTDSQTFTVTVNNVVPVAEAGGDQTAAEGSPVSFTGSFTDPGNDSHTISWDFGDGTVVTGTLTPTHTYTQDGVFTVTLTVTDEDGAVGTDTSTVTVTNVPPTVDTIADQTVDDGSEFVLTATFNDPGNDTQTVVIDWGDGASDTLTVGPEAGGNISAPHTYADDGVFTVTLTITDDDGGTDTQTFTVTVNNVVPVAEAGGDQTAAEGSPVSFTGSFTDPGNNTHSISWDFGDGTVVTDTLTPSHTYTQDGVFTVTLTVTDDDGAVGTDTLIVTVTNVAPVVDTIPDQTVGDGSEFVLSATFNDPGNDTQTVVLDWGDGSPTDTQTVGPEAGGNISATHTYADDGVFTVTVTVTDESGDSDTQTFTVTVENIIPVADAGPDQNVTEGDTVSFTGSFSDQGTDTHTIEWDFGDGTTVTDTLTPTHTYANDGVFTVTLTVTDDDGAVGTDTLLVTVANAAPVVQAGPDQSVPEGTMVNLAPATFTDAGVLDVHTATIDWGDGTSNAGLVNEANGSGTVSGSHTYTDDGTYTVTVEVADETGATGSGTFIVEVSNVAPAAEAGPDQNVSEGLPVHFAATVSDPGMDPVSVSWDFGDGSPASTSLTPIHTYVQDGTYTVTLTATDDDGAVGTDTLTVTVLNVPAVVDAGPDQSSLESQSVSLTATFSDQGGLDVHTATIDWGDGTTETVLVNESGGNGTLSGTHTYVDNGVFIVEVTVIDDAGGVGTDQATITVGNVAPVVESGPDQSISEGGEVTLTSSFTDPGTADTHSVSWDFGDGSAPGSDLVVSHTYVQDGVYTATVTVTDNDGAVGTASTVVTVGNIAPSVTAGADQSRTEGELVSLESAVFADPGILDTHSATVDWGDGTSTPAAISAGNVLNATHLYADNGLFTVTLTVADETGASGTDSFSVSVANAAPVANAGGDQSVPEGATVSFAGSFIDVGTADTHSVSWDFGDGATSTGTLTPSHAYVQDGTYTVTLTVTDDDGGTGTDTLSVLVNNAAPVVTAAADQTIQIGNSASLAGTTFTDAGIDDVHTAAVDWGDGTTEAATVIQQPGGGTVEGLHVYSQPGTFQVLINVTDEALGIGSAALTVIVEDTTEPPKKKKKMKNKKKGKKKSKKNKSKKSKSKKSKSKKSKKKSMNSAGH